ncbi:uncharacterized protein LOC110986914 isoform X2 [Acanthaster planci]|uniref:Uncharacterized protein LOC110986914 isoform X2 n=1 Tax=Acanthaster planci TaxID=133434 RepID=A0A8B7ZJ49_ACAPL|nr:uncharacterized protein LOC110986914 isoform X2 [Acanthaster planci]
MLGRRRNWISGGMDDKNKLTLDPSNTLQNQVLGTIYGNCIGDAIGLMTEFLSKDQARKYYGGKHLEYPMKEIAAAKFFHQMVFPEADWTDDSDQMILILQSLMDNNGKANAVDFSKKLLEWVKHGFAELGDPCGMGLGQTTSKVVHHENFTTDPHEAALSVWEKSNRTVAPNGGVMRTSIVGVHQYDDISQVIGNTKVFCKVTHADPRCVASCVAVTTAISMMLQGLHKTSKGHYDVARITEASFNYAKECLLRDDKGNLDEEQVRELQFHMNASLSELELDDRKKIGYTFKCLGAGFWALRQSSFRDAIEAITLEGGDADTNGAVAGALLGCKLGYCKLPSSWKNELKHKEWLDDILARYFQSGIMTESCGTPVDGPEVGIRLTGGEQDDAEQATAPKTGGDCSSATDTTKDMTTELSAEVKVQSADLSPDQQASISKSEVTAEGQQDPEDPHRSKDQPEEASEVTAETEVRGQCNSPASDPTEATQIGESSGDLSETKPEDLACQ